MMEDQFRNQEHTLKLVAEHLADCSYCRCKATKDLTTIVEKLKQTATFVRCCRAYAKKILKDNSGLKPKPRCEKPEGFDSCGRPSCKST